MKQIIPRQKTLVSRDWLSMAAMTVIMVIVWIAFGVYRILKTSAIGAPQAQKIESFSPDLDVVVLDTLASHRQLLDTSFNEEQRIKNSVGK